MCEFIEKQRARFDKFVQERVPTEFFRGPVPKETCSMLFKVGVILRDKPFVGSIIIIALVRKYPRMKYAFQQGLHRMARTRRGVPPRWV